MSTIQQVTLEPCVALALLDYHERRPDSITHVSGVILGGRSKGTIELRNWVGGSSVQGDYITKVQRSCPKDMPMGWFTTGPEDFSADAELRKEVETKVPSCVLLQVWLPTAECPKVRFRAFTNVSVSLSGTAAPCICRKEIPCVVGTTDPAATVALDSMVSDLFPETARISDPTRILCCDSGMNRFELLLNLRQNLALASDYVADVLSGKRPPNKEAGRELLKTLSAHEIQNDDLTRAELDMNMKDALLFQYISQLLNQRVMDFLRREMFRS